MDVNKIKRYISEISFVKEILHIENIEGIIRGKIEITFKELTETLNFDFEIFPQYPLKAFDAESIKFYNKNLLKYNHVMEDGMICIHTSHSLDMKQKLHIDFAALKNWIIQYYINGDEDSHYEHLIVPKCLIRDKYYSFIFTNLDFNFKKGDYGKVNLSMMTNGFYGEKVMINYLVQQFIIGKEEVSCKWSTNYINFEHTNYAFFYFLKDPPARFNRFIYLNWSNFKELFSDDFLRYLHQFKKENLKKLKDHLIPLFIGYRTVPEEIHWQVAVIEMEQFPLRGVPIKINNVKTGQWKGELIDGKISWAISRDVSYKYFFGRGAFVEKITNSKVLIIGIGAIGSMIAKTLTRGGCKYIDIADYDIKEPENVCRSEYFFKTGISNKEAELLDVLSAISPFVNVRPVNKTFFQMIKAHYDKTGTKKDIEAILNQYDIIWDCTTDNDLMYVLDLLEIDCDLINMSISNHAKDLVCAFYPNIYAFVNHQFGNIINNNVEDLYNPTGCWSPTFKASYNDIATMVQLALKQINRVYEKGLSKDNFIIRTDEDRIFNLKIENY